MSQDGAAFFDAVNAYIVADVRGDVEPLDELEPVTARLISVAIGPHPLYAAAPDLLAALKRILSCNEVDVHGLAFFAFDADSHAANTARAAIAKAEGR